MTEPGVGIRGVEARLHHYKTHGAPRAGLCAQAVREALNAPWQGLPSAAAVLDRVPGPTLRQNNAPRGSIVYWTGGRQGYGHCCFAMGDHLELSVDVLPGRPGEADIVPFGWFGLHWPSLQYAGWSWWWGSVPTRPTIKSS